MPSIVIVGAGPGVSASLARRYAREGYAVGLVGLEPGPLADLSAELGAVTERADVTDASAHAAAVTRLGERLGGIDVLHFNPSAFREKDPLELTVPELLEDVALGVGALLTALQAARPFLAPGGRVTATGSMASDAPWHRAASLGVQKAALRNLIRSIDDSLRDAGIRATTVTVRGTLSTEGPFTPDRVAEALWAAARQDEGDWQVEVPYAG